MNNIYNAVVYPYLSEEIDMFDSLLQSTGLNEEERQEHLLHWISNKNYTILGLYAKAPKYLSGVELYQEFYGVFTPTGQYKNLAVKETFSDVIGPRILELPIQSVDDINNRIYLGGNFTDEIFINDLHTILDTSNNYTPLLQTNVINVTYLDMPTDATLIEFSSVDLSNIVPGDILYFQKGQELVGIDHLIQWYNLSGEVIFEKTFKERFEQGEAAKKEFNRRQITISRMVNLSDGTAVQPFVKSIYEFFKDPYIDNYIQLGKFKEFKNAIDATTVSNEPIIGTYLDIEIPVTDIENVTEIKKIRDWIKDSLYEGYK